MKHKKKIVIVGATSAIAERCARLWVENEAIDLVLVGRDAKRVERVAADLRVRSPESTISILQAEFLNTDSINATVSEIARLGCIDIVLIAHGFLPEQTKCQSDLRLCYDALNINAISPVLFAEAFSKELIKFDHGTIALIGSVAGDRGRQSNYIYGAAKGLVERYAEGLQHRFFGTNINALLIKPGPTDTPMTAHLKENGASLASVGEVAQNIINAIDRGKMLTYAPCRWRYIMWVVRNLPAFIFNKIRI